LASWLPYLLLPIGFALLVLGAEWLVAGASAVARRWGISDLVVGLTVVAFGTSAPELVVNLVAAAQGYTEMAIGNILGSNTFNVLLILGVAALIRPLSVTQATVWKEIPLSLLAAVLVGVMTADRVLGAAAADGLSRVDGLVLLAFFGIFLVYMLEAARKGGQAVDLPEDATSGQAAAWTRVVLGLGFLFGGGRAVVTGAVAVAAGLGMSEGLIALTIVSIGTSLPELATSAVAARRGNCDIAVGNVVGSNIFNVFFVLGTSALIRPLPFAPDRRVDVLVTVAASLFLFLAAFTGRRHRIDRWEGAVFLVAYASYLGYLVVRG
jgi:cation:H+ antiporter